MQSLILATILSIGLCFAFPAASASAASAEIFLLDSSGKVLSKIERFGYVQVNTIGDSQAYSINDAGQVASTFYAEDKSSASFITGPNGVGMTGLGTLGGKSSVAYGINNAGQVVGWSVTAAGDKHAFITAPNGVGMTDLGTLGGNDSFAYGINNSGQVVGWSYTAAGDKHAFITAPNGVGMTDLGTLGGNDSFASDVNDSGQVVGSSATAEGYYHHAFITGPNGIGMTDLGTLGGNSSVAYGINNSGQVVGWSYPAAGAQRGFITDPNGGDMTDLGVPDGQFIISSASGINNAGQVVGKSLKLVGEFPALASEWHAFITGPNGVGMTDLISLAELPPGYVMTDAVGINDNGQILVAATIPEPQSYALMLAGLGLIGFVAWRQKSGSRIQY
jgi:probable HAF family extracellular repeat protein